MNRCTGGDQFTGAPYILLDGTNVNDPTGMNKPATLTMLNYSTQGFGANRGPFITKAAGDWTYPADINEVVGTTRGKVPGPPGPKGDPGAPGPPLSGSAATPGAVAPVETELEVP